VSQLLIQQYLNDLAKLKQVSGTHRESVVREAFKDLLKAWARSMDLTFVPEYQFETKTKDRRYVDGALLHTLRVPFGYWEAKDSNDDLDAEIQKKFRAGYPKTNIIFEDSTEAALFQHGEAVMRCGVEDTASLEKLLRLFFGYERPEIEAFRKAADQFKTDLPSVLDALRSMISRAYQTEANFQSAASDFLAHAQDAVNPALTEADVREMLIQHVLTGEVFSAVFPGTTYHEDNSVARELYKLETTFFTGNTKFQTLKGLEPYYGAIRKAANQIITHHEKQTFLKAIYENFYKVYNPKAADRLGVVYTPNEIVRFMIDSADWLCEQHFRRNLIDDDVDILDPATGTGTFICELIEHFAGQPKRLTHKYRHGLHANEVAILPYYVANLNIEATYAAATGHYEEFPGLCFVDTLDNTYALRKYRGHMDDLFGSVSGDNMRRIRVQNSRRISVIIGNPPYNANQLNENENNKNREYPEIDKRIKQTYIAESAAQKTKLYDMYARFFRWASDRLDENGILAFISNRSFIEKRTFDGFRAVVANEFNEIFVLDLGGDVRANPKLSGTTHSVFGIQTGVAISFMVRRSKRKGCRIFYGRRPEIETAEEKLAFLGSTKLHEISFDEVKSDKSHNWINLASNDFDLLLPLASKETKAAKKAVHERAIFKLYSLGISTNRDEWVYGESREVVEQKMQYFVPRYEAQREDTPLDLTIKWSRNLKRRREQGLREPFSPEKIVQAQYRPFTRRFLYDSDLFIDEGGSKDQMFPIDRRNRAICFSDVASRTAYCVLAVDGLADLHFGSSVDAYQQAPLHRFVDGEEVDNITDWALEQFKKHYETSAGKRTKPVTKEAIFYYVYGVLYDPMYREKYALNLRRELPRIPFYTKFWEWVDWGRALMDLHLRYESPNPAALKRVDVRDEKSRKAGLPPKVLLRADKDHGIIHLDSETTLTSVPSEAWEYRLGSRSALEWVLDQSREKTPKHPTIRERFNSYDFEVQKEAIITLIRRITTVSLETVLIIQAMKSSSR
jgi:predicted helicase